MPNNTGQKHIFILTGDPSGDVHAATVASALEAALPDVVISAVGGACLAANPRVRLLATQEKMGKVGFDGVLSSFYHLLLGWKLLKLLKTNPPDAVLLIDYGGFNLRMARFFQQQGWPVLYYIPPQIWASRPGRIKKIKEYVDHVFCIFPFEEPIYQRHGIPVTYVGHPLVGQLPPPADRYAFCQAHGLSPDQKLIGLFPGSRQSEIKALLPRLIESIPGILQQYPDSRFLLAQSASVPKTLFRNLLEKACRHLTADETERLIVLRHANHTILSIVDAAMLASGTVTLEAALYGTPMVITYRLPAWIWAIGKRLMSLPCIGLPNILTDPYRPVVPECLQKNANPDELARRLTGILPSGAPERQAQEAAFAQIQTLLYQGNAAQKVADGIVRYLRARME